ncbi:MAG: outer membrane beta-barrel protein [Cellulophaga sp.]
MKFKLAAIIFVLGASTILAQNNVKGTVSDLENIPLAFANIVLYETENKKPVTGAISDGNGNYQLKDIANGNYYIEASVMGFKTKKTDAFQLEKTTKELNFSLEEETQSLNEVVVKGKRPVIRQTAEKLIVDLENSDMVNTNLKDVVKKVPGIIMTNGNISYAGQGNIRILINGKTTNYMDTATLLKDLPADNIAKVELIQQPGSEYDAEGSGPILNIILRKNVNLGTHGNIRSMVGYDNRFEYRTSASIASYKNKLNWEAYAGYSKSTYREDLILSRKVLEKTYSQTSISPFAPVSLNTSGRLDYFLNNKHSIGLSARRLQSDSDRTSANSTSIFSGNTETKLFTDNRFNRERITYTLNPYYEFDDEKNRLTLDFNYVNYSYDNENNLFKTKESIIDYDSRKYFQEATYKIYTYKGDYKKNVSDDFSWSIGVKYSDVTSNSNLRSLIEDTNGEFQFQPDQSNRFIVDETIKAAYSKVNFKEGKWSFSGGLRWEESDTKGLSTSTNEVRSRKISKLFPSASISREITDELGASFAYSYRIRRPSYSSLNSFVYYYDPYTFEEGNPNLKPSFTNSYQFNLTYEGQPFFNVNYRETSDILFEIISQNDTSAETSRSIINLAENKNWSLSLFAPLSFIKGLDGYTGIIANHNSYVSESLTPKLDLSKWSVTWYTSAEYELPWEINSEISGFYTSGGLEGIIEYKWLAGLDIAFSKKFLKDKLKVSLEYEELITRAFHGEVKYANVNANITSDWTRHNVYLQFNYSFGSKFGKNKDRGNASKEEQNRIKNNN